MAEHDERAQRAERDRLCAMATARLEMPQGATYKDACRRTGELMGELLEARVTLRFAALGGTPFSGATVRFRDGSYVVYCANSRSWYHRLGILLHELAHVLLGHEPATAEGMRRQFMPHVPGRMARLVAGRTAHAGETEREAEELADLLLERLTDQRNRQAEALPPQASQQVRRIAEGLSHRRGRE